MSLRSLVLQARLDLVHLLLEFLDLAFTGDESSTELGQLSIQVFALSLQVAQLGLNFTLANLLYLHFFLEALLLLLATLHLGPFALNRLLPTVHGG